MEAIKIYTDNGKEVKLYHTDDGMLINATEAANAFEKSIDEFLNDESVKRFVDFLNSKKDRDYITTNEEGMWMHGTLAWKFASWLSLKFEDWIFTTFLNFMSAGDSN